MTLSSYLTIPDDPTGGYTYEGTFYDDAHSLVLTGMLGFCGCGMPEEAARFVRDVMIHVDAGMKLNRKDPESYPRWETLGRELGSLGALYFAYYVLAEKDLTEHGGAVPGWLSDKGRMVLACLLELPEEAP